MVLDFMIVSFILGLNLNSNDVSAISSVIYTIFTGALVYIAYKANKNWQEQKKYEEKHCVLTELEKILNPYKDKLEFYKKFNARCEMSFDIIFGEIAENFSQNNIIDKLKHIKQRASRVGIAIPNIDFFRNEMGGVSKFVIYSASKALANKENADFSEECKIIVQNVKDDIKKIVDWYSETQNIDSVLTLVNETLNFCDEQLTI